jgi:hypothetical protein
METSIDRIRAKIAELEARIADLRTAERELEALDAAPALRPKPKAKRTVGAAIAEVLSRSGALPLAELAEQMRMAGRELSAGTLSNTLQTMKKRGMVKSGGGKWMLPKARAKRAGG